MKLIALVLAMFMVASYIKTSKTLFKSSYRMKRELDEAIMKMKVEMGDNHAKIMLCILTFVLWIFTFIYYVVTASVMNDKWLTVLGSVILVSSFITAWRTLVYIVEEKEDLKFGILNRLTTWLGLVYLVMFFILFFK